jgi:hypothetical protein
VISVSTMYSLNDNSGNTSVQGIYVASKLDDTLRFIVLVVENYEDTEKMVYSLVMLLMI